MNSIKRVMPYVSKYKLLFFIPIILLMISIAVDMVNPILVRDLIDKVIEQGQTDLLKNLIIIMLTITLVRSIFSYVRSLMMEKLAESTAVELRNRLFNHVQGLPFQFFDGMNTGELMSRMTGDIDSIKSVLAYGLSMFVENVAYFILASIILFKLNWVLALVSLITIPFTAFAAFRLEKRMGDVYSKISDQAAALNTTAEENIAGVRLVKAFARESFEKRKFYKENMKMFELGKEEVKVLAKYYPIIEAMGNFSLVLLLVMGGYAVINDWITIGTLVAFTGYIWMLIWPMRMLGWLLNMLAQFSAAVKKIFRIMDTGSEIKEPDMPATLESIKGDVAFENVSFSYREHGILKNISFHARAGQTIAIMGATGSGKTSLINLIGRYYDCTQGNIIVDDINVKDISLKTLRGSMAVVMQDTFLFSDTIEANIAFGNPNASRQDIIRAAKAAEAHDFILETQDGYETVVGERGIGLSGGQKQRISLARAILKNPSILVLDDATSAVDMETEHKIQQSLREIMKNCTTFIIAHRISSVRNADEILILDEGVVVERGNHKELLKKRGRYYELYLEQYKDFNDFLIGVI